MTYHHRTPSTRPASPKKLAYLRYMQMPYPAEMDEEAAERLIQELENVSNYEGWSRLLDKKCAWRTERFILHPTLFRNEFQIYHEKELPHALKSYLFEEAPTSSLRRLSLANVRDCMKELDKTEPLWWQSPKVQEDFMQYYLQREKALRQKEEGGLPLLWEQVKEAVSALSALTPNLFKSSPEGSPPDSMKPC